MNRVGVKGKGESVWLGWFLFDAIMAFAPIARSAWRRPSGAMAAAIMPQACATRWNTQAWDGDWYRRGYFDDGSAAWLGLQPGMPHRLHCRSHGP